MRTTLGIAAVVLPLLVACGAETSPTASPASSAPTTSDAPTTDQASPTPTESSADVDVDRSVVYYVGDTPQGERLFAERHPVESGADGTGLLDALSQAPQDPDYRSLVPPGGAATLVPDDSGTGAVLLDLGADSTWVDRGDLTKAQARLAAQAVLRTLAGDTREASLYAFSGDEPSTLFGLDTSAGIAQVADLEVLALVNLRDPFEGAPVSGSELEVDGLASSFEATVPWTITDGSGAEVDSGHFTADGWMDGLYPFDGTIDVSGLEPGSYVLAASTDDPSDGEGFGPTTDTRTFVVE